MPRERGLGKLAAWPPRRSPKTVAKHRSKPTQVWFDVVQVAAKPLRGEEADDHCVQGWGAEGPGIRAGSGRLNRHPRRPLLALGRLCRA